MSFINNEDIICKKEKNLFKKSNNNNSERNKFSKINLIYRKYILTERRDKNKKKLK